MAAIEMYLCGFVSWNESQKEMKPKAEFQRGAEPHIRTSLPEPDRVLQSAPSLPPT